MYEQIYQPSSSGSDSDFESFRVLRSSQTQIRIGSQSSDIADNSPSPSLTPTCQKRLKAFTFSVPTKKRRTMVGKQKRSFQGNQHKKTAKKVSPIPKSPITSAASRKIIFESPVPKVQREITIRTPQYDSLDVNVHNPIGNCIISFGVLQSMFDLMLCGQCSSGSLCVSDSGTRAGSAHYILLSCKNCRWGKYFWTVSGRFGSKIAVGNQQIPKRNELVYSSLLAGRLIGVGIKKLSLYHAILNMVPPLTHNVALSVQNDIVTAAEFVAIQSMETARNDLIVFHQADLPDGYVSTVASFDGAYQMRSGKAGGGFSRFCFGAAISVTIAKVVSYGIASNSCSLCTQYQNKKRAQIITEDEFRDWKVAHEPLCTAEYSQYASVQLESALAPSVVSQALERGIVFSGIVTDGDNKTHEVLRKANLYNHLGISSIGHLECLSHVAKRLKTNLCKRQDKVMKSVRSKKEGAREFYSTELHMSHGDVRKRIDTTYRGKLRKDSRQRNDWGSDTSHSIRTVSDAMAAQIASYYRMAIKRNVGDTRAILESIKAIPLHLGANDSNADEFHRFCPKDSDSWCRYQAAITSGLDPPTHPNFLSGEAVDLVQSLFSDFGYDSEDFVKRIQDGRDSNHNEAIHSVLWSMVPKNEPTSYSIMRLGSALAVIRYNDGWNGIQKLCATLGISSTANLSEHLNSLDRLRITKSSKQLILSQKRFAKKQLRPKRVQQQLKVHGEGYVSGKFSGAQSKATVPVTESDPESPCVSDDETVLPTTRDTPTSSTQIQEDFCVICGGTEENGLVGIGVQLQMSSEDIAWVCCEICDQWHHVECMGLDLDDVDGDDPWYCPDCSPNIYC